MKPISSQLSEADIDPNVNGCFTIGGPENSPADVTATASELMVGSYKLHQDSKHQEGQLRTGRARDNIVI